MPEMGVGVDWASGSWLVVALDDDGLRTATVEDGVEDAWENHGGKDARVAIDVPIGLLSNADDRDNDEELSRDCDDLARDAVGGDRSPAVFNAPSRDAVEAKLGEDGEEAEEATHGEVSETNEEVTGKGLSSQSYNIIGAIGEVDRFLRRESPDIEPDEQDGFGSFLESHPEVCFRAFRGEDLEHSKNSPAGVAERLEAIDGELPSGEEPETLIREICKALLEEDGTSATFDDALDACALAITALGDNELKRMPPERKTDEGCLPMQIVYRAENSLVDGEE